MAILFADRVFLEHETGDHPESPARLRSISRHLETAGLITGWTRRESVEADDAQLELVHSREYIQSLRAFVEKGGGQIEASTVVCPRSESVARRAAGTAVAAVEEVLAGRQDRAVCLLRPPGHHALPDKAMGFCLYNNVAIAARYALREHRLSRILIIDWDVHHGNGTQDIFYDSAEVFFFSVHRSPFYPGTGAENETGTQKGLGTTFNLPLTFGISRQEYRERFQRMLEDALTRCRPELILISAGFDAHADDPVGSLGLQSEDFRDLTQSVIDAAEQYCDGRLVSLLEGGYNVVALAESVGYHLQTLSPPSAGS